MSVIRTPDTDVSRKLPEEAIVTGAAVELDIHPASPLLRMGATAVDLFLGTLSAFVIFSLAGNVIAPPNASIQRVYIIGFIVMVLVGIPFLIEVLSRGRSLGKWAFGIRVLRDDGGVITARHVITRVLTGVVEVWMTMGAVALFASFISPKGKRLGDLAAGTVVVTEPQSYSSAPIMMPPDAAEWANSAVILPLPDDLHRDVVAFLQGTRTMNPQLRDQVSSYLASQVQQYVSPLPTELLHPERFLAAVVVVLRDRQWRRIAERDRHYEARRTSAHVLPFELDSQ